MRDECKVTGSVLHGYGYTRGFRTGTATGTGTGTRILTRQIPIPVAVPVTIIPSMWTCQTGHYQYLCLDNVSC
jgi:hypothetical protein